MGVRSFKCGSLGVWNMIELMGHCMKSQVSLFVCAYVHMSEVKAQMNNPYQFIQVERATALVLWLHHDDRCHGRDLSSAAWDSFCSTHPPVVSPVSKSLRDQCVFTPVVMFFFSSCAPPPGVSHGGWKAGGSEGEIQTHVRVFSSFSNSFNCSAFFFFLQWTQTDQITAHCTPPHQDTVFLFIFDSKSHCCTLQNFWLGFC